MSHIGNQARDPYGGGSLSLDIGRLSELHCCSAAQKIAGLISQTMTVIATSRPAADQSRSRLEALSNSYANHSLPWHFVSLAALLLVPSWVVFAAPLWAIPRADRWLVIGIGAGYVFAATATYLLTRMRRFPRMLAAAAISAITLTAAFLGALLVPSLHFSRQLLVAGSLAIPIGLLAPAMVARSITRPRWRIAVISALVSAAGLFVWLRANSNEIGPQVRIRHVSASQQFLTVAHYLRHIPRAERYSASGGAIAAVPGTGAYILVRARGDIYSLKFSASGALSVEDLELQAPINEAEFYADLPAEVPKDGFRVADLVVTSTSAGIELLVSHHYWKSSERCFVTRVSALEISAIAPRSARGGAPQWRTLFESQPCLPIGPSRGMAFAGKEVGGNLEVIDNHRVLLTIGDHQFDGWYKSPDLVSARDAHNGKTVLIDTRSGRWSIFTTGHRNAQGLVKDRYGRIWSTEHGPQGGDELNLLQIGEDFGYPRHTLGTDYGSVVWPPGTAASDGDGSVDPVFAWVPSIGISDLVSVDDPAFPRWRDDLLIASLRGRSVWRVRVKDNRVLYAEPIEIGERVRDIAAGAGEFVLWTDSGTIVRMTGRTGVDDGSVLFARYCGGCHDDEDDRIGPNLRGVLGRKPGGKAGYGYSQAMRSLGGRWTEETLHAFLANPGKLAPGTSMRFEGVPDALARTQIVEYIKAFY